MGKRLTRPRNHDGVKVAFFVDTYVNRHAPELGEAFVNILRHNGISVFVPPRQLQAGSTAIASGALDTAAKIARRNLRFLGEAIRRGYRIVATEPAAALTLIREYGYLFDDNETRQIAENTCEASTFLWELHSQKKLKLDFHPIEATIAYHTPCRIKALEVGTPGLELLRLIPGLSVQSIEAGCCGMAGTFGIKHRTYRTSLRIGRHLMGAMRDPSIQAGATECSACKIQMEQGTAKPTFHPIRFLAAAYGFLEPSALLATKSKELTVS